MVERTLNQLFAWITELNISDAKPPKFKFYEEAHARKEMAEFLISSSNMVDLKQSEVYERLQLTKPKLGDEIIPRKISKTSQRAAFNNNECRCNIASSPTVNESPNNNLHSCMIKHLNTEAEGKPFDFTECLINE